MKIFAGLLCFFCMGISVAQQAPDIYSLKVAHDCSVYANGQRRAAGSTPQVRIGTSDWIEVGKSVTVCIDGLSEAEKTLPASVSLKDMRLFLAGHMLPLEPSLIAPTSQSYINFQLEFPDNDVDRKTWSYVIAESRKSPTHEIPISVGFKDRGQPLESDTYTQLHLYPRMQTLIFIPFLLLLLGGLIYCAATTDLLRDTSFGKDPAAGKLPFSLGRVQMAWWFFLVMTTYLYLWVITRTVPPISAQVLALLGISAGTGLGAAFIDQGKVSSQAVPRDALITEQSALNLRITDLNALAPPTGTPLAAELELKRNRLAVVTANLAAVPATVVPVTAGFFRDLLQEAGLISFHRFQIVGWTAAFGMIFLVTAYASLVMPTFDNTLLVLMGISSGTYLGFKLPSS